MKYLLMTVLFTLTMVLAAGAQCSDADKKALEQFDHAWGTASENGDRGALTPIYADDYIGMPGMQGKAAAIDGTVKAAERTKANPAGADKITYDNYRISCTANTATITHRNTIWTPDGTGGKPETFYTRSVHFLEKRDGKWQVVSNAGGGGLDDYDVVWYLEQDWNNAFWKKDGDWFKSTFTPDFRSISSSSAAITNKDEEIASITGDKSTYDLVETKDMNIRMDGNVALVTGIFHLKGKDEKGVAFDHNIRYTDTWVKRDGRWMAWSSHGTMMK